MVLSLFVYMSWFEICSSCVNCVFSEWCIMICGFVVSVGIVIGDLVVGNRLVDV